MSLVKYRLKEVATDFGVTPKDIAEVMGKFFEKPKSNTQVLTEDELNVIFDYMTQTNQISSLEAVFAVQPKPKAEEPKAEEKPAEEKKPEEAKAEEEQARKDELLKQYIERDRIRTYSDKYQGAGFSKEYADKMASLLPDGVKDEYFDNLKASNAETMARLKAEALNSQPKPTTGTPPTPKDLGKTEEDKLLEAMKRGAGII